MYSLTKRELLERVGNMNQIAGMKRYTCREGKKESVNAVDIWNGSGMYLTVLSDRASDIASLTYKGRSLCWLSNLGLASPLYKTKGDFDWNRNFSGGMLATCGLNTAGLPSHDQEEDLELHGPISNLPSEEVNCRTFWKDDDYIIQYTAKTYQSRPFGENLCLTREITVKMGENVVYVHDNVENLGFQDVPLMMIYHMNFGYPLLDEGSHLYLTYQDRIPTSTWAADSEDQIGVITKPDDHYKARAYNHTLQEDEEGYGYASLLNEELGLGATLKIRTDNLDQFNLWKCLQKSNYAVGLEPCNCRTWGRDQEREHGNLHYIKSMESKDLYFELHIHDGARELEEAAARYSRPL